MFTVKSKSIIRTSIVCQQKYFDLRPNWKGYLILLTSQVECRGFKSILERKKEIKNNLFTAHKEDTKIQRADATKMWNTEKK